MKVKVIVDFNDKETSERHNVNDIIEVSEERAKELISKKVVELIIDKPEEKKSIRRKK